MSQKTIQMCPNCGAEMQKQGLSAICLYCGTHFDLGNYKRIVPSIALSWEITERFNYIKSKEQSLELSGYVDIRTDNTTYHIKSNPSFYANDGNYNRILDYNLSLEYFNDGNTESLFLVVDSSKDVSNSYLSILLDYRFHIAPPFVRKEMNNSFYKLALAELKQICASHTIIIYSNLLDCEYASYKEFTTYCCRFYNITFDKRKFLYSIHQHLISDENGK